MRDDRLIDLVAVIVTVAIIGLYAGLFQSTAAAQDTAAARKPRTATVDPSPTPQAPPPRQYPRVEYDADLRGFVFTGGLTNKGGRPENPYGEQAGWRIGDPGVIYDHLDLGLDRTILRQPVGPGTIGWVLFSSWHPLSDLQRLDFAAGVRQWLGEDHRRRVGVFFGRDATNPYVRRDVGIAEGPLLRLDPNDPQALLWWRQNTDPLLAIGVSEFWLDRGSANDSVKTRRAIVQLARRVRLLQGAKVGVESVPQKLNAAGVADYRLGLDWDYLTKVPAMGHWRYIWTVWLNRGLRDLLVVPPELHGAIELHVFLAKHAPHLPTPSWPEPTTGDVAWFEAAGWTVSWLSRVGELDDGPPAE